MTTSRSDGESGVVYLDIETWSTTDLLQVGSHRYAQAEDLQVLLIAWAVGDGPIRLAAPDLKLPFEPDATLADFRRDCMRAHTIYTHNVEFDRSVCTHHLNLLTRARWRCTYLASAAMGLPRSLNGVGKMFRIGQKSAVGHDLTLKMSKSKQPPANVLYDIDRTEMARYVRQDVELLRKTANLDPIKGFFRRKEWEDVCEVAFEMNEHGVAVDTEFVEALQPSLEMLNIDACNELGEMSGGAITGPAQYAVQKQWFIDQGLDQVTSVKEEALKRLSRNHIPRVAQMAQRIMDLRNSSQAKFKAMAACVCEDGTLKGMMKAFGAHTHRWSSVLVQLQNMPRGAPLSIADTIRARDEAGKGDSQSIQRAAAMLDVEPMLLAKTLVRTAIVPVNDVFVSLDYAQIELRILSWLADQGDILAMLRKGEDVYRRTAAGLYNCRLDEVTSSQRHFGKQYELALGYKMGPDTFAERCEAGGIKLEPEQMGLPPHADVFGYVVNKYREDHEAVTAMWGAATDAMGRLASGRSGHFGVGARVGLKRLTTTVEGGEDIGIMEFMPPSKLPRFYWNFGTGTRGDGFRYYRHGGDKPGWKKLYGGMLVENLCQVLAADIMNAALVRVHNYGLNPVFTVHDEIVLDVSHDEADDAMAEAARIMEDVDDWASEIPISVNGAKIPFYTKV